MDQLEQMLEIPPSIEIRTYGPDTAAVRERMIKATGVLDQKPRNLATADMLRRLYSEDRGWLLPVIWGQGGNKDCGRVSHCLFSDIAPLFPKVTKFCIGWCILGQPGAEMRGWHYWVEFSNSTVIDASGGQISVESVNNFNRGLKPVKVMRFSPGALIQRWRGKRLLPLDDPATADETYNDLADQLEQQMVVARMLRNHQTQT